MTFTVFISHCIVAEDLPIVDEFAKRLRVNGMEPYIAERDPQPGTSLSAKILKRIRDSDIVAVLWTKNGAASQFVNQEVGVATDAGKTVVPLVETGVRVKGLLEGLEWVVFDRKDPDSALRSLDKFLSKHRDAKALLELGTQTAELWMWAAVIAAIVAVLVIVLMIWGG